MAVEGGAAPYCGKNTLTQSRRQCLKPKQSSVPKQEQLCSRQPRVVSCFVSSYALKFWLAASICLNAFFLSALLRISIPRTSFPTKQVIEKKGQSCVNGLGNVNAGLHDQHCSGQGHHEYDRANGGRCRCYACFTGSRCSEIIKDCTVNLDHGDPKLFENYWSSNKNAVSTVLRGGDRMSYFSHTDAICWFLEPALATEIVLMHKMVGNAITDGFHIVVGTGSSQLIGAALYALSSSPHRTPVDVVSAVPFYSSYPPMTDFLKSQLHRWAGDASSYKWDCQSRYIELVTSPGNPDGMLHTTVVNGTGLVIHDLAYYWPHYTPISFTADHDIMLFTFSKMTGHAGTRIGWALVRNAEVARRMTKYMELSTIGVSKDSQFRVSEILKSIRASYSKWEGHGAGRQTGLFDFGYQQMSLRWKQIRTAVESSECFFLEKFPSGFCSFFGKETSPHPAFAWLRCEKDEDCYEVFRAKGILTRSGTYFGSSPKYVRISMVDHDKIFQIFIERLQHMADSCSHR